MKMRLKTEPTNTTLAGGGGNRRRAWNISCLLPQTEWNAGQLYFEDELNLCFEVATIARWISAVRSDSSNQMAAETENLGWMEVKPFRGFWEDMHMHILIFTIFSWSEKTMHFHTPFAVFIHQ